MQTSVPTPPVRRERRRPQISCTECRRRKQKCNFRKDGPCTNCLRRYPPVACYVQDLAPIANPNAKETSNSKKRNTTGGGEEILGGHAVPQKPNHQDEENNTRAKYTSIPLSRILHPVSDCTEPWRVPRLLKQDINLPTFTSSEFVHDEDDVEDADEEEEMAVSQRQKLVFLDPGFKEVMYKRFEPQLGSPRPIGGMLEMLNSFNAFPVKTTLRNSELFNFYHQYVAPRLCSIDGSGFHPLFAEEILPWQIQSPLMPNVAILMASATQGYLRDPESEMTSEALVIKQHVLALVNRFIRQDFHVVGHQAMRIVIHLVIIEWWWGSTEALWSHMAGIKRMLELRGGLLAMNDPLNMHVLIVTDYELACGYETDLIFQSTTSALSTPLPIPETYPEKFRCPLMRYPTTFRDCAESLGISILAAEVLDDVRFLTSEITDVVLDLESEYDVAQMNKIKSTAAWTYKQRFSRQRAIITESTPLEDIINDTILLAAQVYTHAISTSTPFTESFPKHLQERFYQNISLVPLSNWSTIPGIFFWILLVATPASDGDYRGRFLRKQMACTGMSISLENFFLGTAFLRAFWAVQVWIRGEREKGRGSLGGSDEEIDVWD